MKFVERRPFAEPDLAAHKLVEIANDVEPVQDGHIYIERVNAPFLAAGGSGDNFRAGVELFTVSDRSDCHANTAGSNGLRLSRAGDRTLL